MIKYNRNTAANTEAMPPFLEDILKGNRWFTSNSLKGKSNYDQREAYDDLLNILQIYLGDDWKSIWYADIKPIGILLSKMSQVLCHAKLRGWKLTEYSHRINDEAWERSDKLYDEEEARREKERDQPK